MNYKEFKEKYKDKKAHKIFDAINNFKLAPQEIENEFALNDFKCLKKMVQKIVKKLKKSFANVSIIREEEAKIDGGIYSLALKGITTLKLGGLDVDEYFDIYIQLSVDFRPETAIYIEIFTCDEEEKKCIFDNTRILRSEVLLEKGDKVVLEKATLERL